MKFQTQFFRLMVIFMFFFMATVGVSGKLKAQESESSDTNYLPREFYDHDDYEERESYQPEYDEQDSYKPEHDEQEHESYQPDHTDLTADTKKSFSKPTD